MMTAIEVALTILNFTAAEFAAAPSVDVSARTDALLMSDFEGIAISAPAEAEAGARLPIAVAVRFDGERAWDFPLARNATLVATNLDTGAVVISDPFRPMATRKRHMERAPLDRGPRPPDDELEGVSADIAWTDAERARLPVEPGRWRISLIYHDWVSNSVEVDVAGDPARATPQAPWPLPGDGASYLARPDAAQLGDRAAEFDVEVATTDGRQEAWLVGQARILRQPWMGYSGTLSDRGTEQEVIGTVPVSAIWARQNGGPGEVLRLILPLYGPASAPDAPTVQAFRVDLMHEAGDYRLPGGRYAVWLLIGGALYGPAPVDID